MTPVLVPQLGNEITEAEVTEWLKAAGDAVEQGEPIVTITTTKMALDIEAPEPGTLSRIVAEEGEVVEVGAVLGEIG
jgi:pyruvate/2-oxoglutarate dehydrogenase complex dihydrolipoamide acyltransferase (E2) component